MAERINPTDADEPMRDLEGMGPNVMDGQVDKMSGTLLDPTISPMGNGILGAGAEGGGDPDQANAMADEYSAGDAAADDPDAIDS